MRFKGYQTAKGKKLKNRVYIVKDKLSKKWIELERTMFAKYVNIWYNYAKMKKEVRNEK